MTMPKRARKLALDRMAILKINVEENKIV